ncbi:uncharacterized protein [Panulirus ornatus]|uniref:uncharacterized protein isoform X2 n=1 Tax=Panulirus ornatus TaxID=150431 RepID=UPI003A86D7AF
MKGGQDSEDTGIVNYKVIEKHVSDPCLTVRITMTKENSSLTFTEDQKIVTEVTHTDEKYDGQIAKCTVIPGFWRPTRRKKRNFLTRKHKKTRRQECMVPGCFTRAYSCRFVEFPDDVEKRTDWANRSKLNEKFPGVDPKEPLPSRIGLCMGHFRTEDFHIVPRGNGKVCTLKEGVNPSLFPWVKLPSNVSSGMDIFDNTKFSREMRLLTLMKNELYHMMNPPVKSFDTNPVESCKVNENHEVPLEVSKVFCNLPRKARPPLYSEHSSLSDRNETSQHISKTYETREAYNISRRNKTRVPFYSGENITSKSSENLHDLPEFGDNHKNCRNFPRKSKPRLPGTSDDESTFDTPLVLRPRSDRILKDRKHAKCKNKNNNRKNKKVAASISNEDCIYDIKIENCEEDEIPEVNFNIEDSGTSLPTDQEQQMFGGFSHFAPIPEATSAGLPSQDILGTPRTIFEPAWSWSPPVYHLCGHSSLRNFQLKIYESIVAFGTTEMHLTRRKS